MSERILYKGPCISNDTWVTGLNNNDCIIGPSGTGKTRSYVLPNILQCSESVIVTSVKDSLCKKTGRALRKNGYQVIEINFQDCAASSYGYNPLMYVRRDQKRGCCHEQDILQIAAAPLSRQDKERPVLGAGRPDGPLSHDFLCAGVSSPPGASSGQRDPAPAGDGERQL